MRNVGYAKFMWNILLCKHLICNNNLQQKGDKRIFPAFYDIFMTLPNSWLSLLNETLQKNFCPVRGFFSSNSVNFYPNSGWSGHQRWTNKPHGSTNRIVNQPAQKRVFFLPVVRKKKHGVISLVVDGV